MPDGATASRSAERGGDSRLAELPPSAGALVIETGPDTVDGAEKADMPELEPDEADEAPEADLELVEPELEVELSAALICPGEAKSKSAERTRER